MYIICICICRYATVLPLPVFHSTKITQMNIIRGCRPYADVLKICPPGNARFHVTHEHVKE